jgi:hypothetical protein
MRNSNSALLVITAALLAGTGLAGAQGMNKGDGASSAPAAEQQAPAEKAAPQGATKHKPAGAMDRKSDSAAPASRETTGQAPQQGEAPKAKTDSGSRSEPAPTASGSVKSGAETKSSPDKATQDKSGATIKSGESAEGKSTTPSTTTGQGAAGTRSAVSLSTEQRTKIRTVIKEKVHAKPATNVNFSISVGTRVPRTVHYYPLPVEVVEIHPAWRGFDFILVGDQIVVIDPGTFEIVAVIEA